MSLVKNAMLTIVGLMVMLMVMMMGMFWYDRLDPYDISPDSADIPHFDEISLDAEHSYSPEHSHAFKGTALIDVDGDGTDEIFVGNGYGADDQLLQFREGAFIDIAADAGLSRNKGDKTTYGALSADFDNNGTTDLLLGREDGLHLLSNTNGRFVGRKLDVSFNESTIPLGLTAGDIDQDGDLDVFAAGYVSHASVDGLNNFTPGYGGSSRLFRNNGDGTFSDITRQSGLEYVHNAFLGVFVDLDNDSLLDLVVAHDTGVPRIYRNNGNLKFVLQSHPLSDNHMYPMGVAVGDYNQDGLTDLFFTNSGSSMPTFIVRGNLESKALFTPKWILLENKGDFVFENVADETRVADYEFSWGATFADLNNDSRQDLLVAQNWADFPPHKLLPLPGRVLLQNSSGQFAPAGAAGGSSNPYFGIAPVVTDFNGDGALDIFWSNVSGPSKALLNRGNDNSYWRLRLPLNAQTIGSKIMVLLSNGQSLTEDLVIGEGLSSDQSSALHFGLGTNSIDRVEIVYPDGTRETLQDISVNQTMEHQPAN